MRDFSELILLLKGASEEEQCQHLQAYFSKACQEDIVWSLALLCQRRPKRILRAKLLRAWLCHASGFPDWLFEDSYQMVGDIAETISLMYPVSRAAREYTLGHWMNNIIGLAQLDAQEQSAKIIEAWEQLDNSSRYVYNKILSGGFRLRVKAEILAAALTCILDESKYAIAYRLSGPWKGDTAFAELFLSPDPHALACEPYPFCSAQDLIVATKDLGEANEWMAEWKWDGLRAQVIVRSGKLHIWTQKGALISSLVPEFAQLAKVLENGTVMDGEIIGLKKGMYISGHDVKDRLSKLRSSRKAQEKVPLLFVAYDLLELGSKDLRSLPLKDRRSLLSTLVERTASDCLHFSDEIEFEDWKDLNTHYNRARAEGTRGLIIKQLDSSYSNNLPFRHWHKWKISALSLRAVLLYYGRGSSGDGMIYTFGLWKGNELVPVAKAGLSLRDAEMKDLKQFLKANTLERFGPVRSVAPDLVFELSYASLQSSPRKKSGFTLYQVEVLAWLRDVGADEAGSVGDLVG